MTIVKTAWKILVAVKDALVLLLLILFFALLYAGLKAARTQDSTPSSGALHLVLDRPVVEQPREIDQYAMLAGAGQAGEYRLRDVVRAIERAADDGAIKAVVLDLDGFGGGGQVAMQRIGAALDKVRAAGKPVLARASYYDDAGYMLAAHASEVWLDPLGMVGVTGPGGSSLYYKGLIDRLGVKAHVYRVGTFKSAIEPFTQTGQSPEARTANEALVEAIWSDWLDHVAKARPNARISAYLSEPLALLRNNGGDTARTALAAGLVDRLGDPAAFDRHVAEIVGESAQDASVGFAAVPLSSYMRRPNESGGQVAVVTVAGEIVDGEAPSGMAGGASIAQLIGDVLADDNMKAIVLRVDSPGGSAAASEEIRLALAEARARGLPVVASMGNVAASGGYWVSTASDMIFAEPATITGSIGVFGILPSFEESLAKIGITSDGVKATPLSGEPDVIGGVSPQFHDLAQASVEDIYGKFIGLVASARKMTPERVDEIGQGRVWAGGMAHQLKLVDRFGGLEEAVAEAARRAKLDGDAAAPRFFDPKPDPVAQFFSMFTGQEAHGSARAPARNILSHAAQKQRETAARVLTDLRGLVEGASIRADCLECRAFTTAPPFRPQEQAGWISALLRWTGAL